MSNQKRIEVLAKALCLVNYEAKNKTPKGYKSGMVEELIKEVADDEIKKHWKEWIPQAKKILQKLEEIEKTKLEGLKKFVTEKIEDLIPKQGMLDGAKQSGFQEVLNKIKELQK